MATKMSVKISDQIGDYLSRNIPCTVVTLDNGSLDVIPSAYLSDGSYTGSREVVVSYDDAGDVLTEGKPTRTNIARAARYLWNNQ